MALILAVVGSILTPSTASADPASDAKDLFTHARELRMAGDCASAVGLFRKAYDVYPEGLGSLRNLAECEESLGHFTSAHRAWLDLRRALLTLQDRKYDGWDRDAIEAAARLAPKLATLTIEVDVVGPSGEARSNVPVEVSLDGEKIAPELIGTPLQRDPGVHTVRVTGERLREAAERTVQLGAGEGTRVKLQMVTAETPLPPAPPPRTSLPATPPLPDEPRPPADGKRTLAWVALGVGGVALVGAGVSLGVRQSALNTINQRCPGYTGCSPTLQGTESTGRTASVLFDVLGVVGVLGVGSGVALLVTGGSPSQPRLAVTPLPGGASAAWSFW